MLFKYLFSFNIFFIHFGTHFSVLCMLSILFTLSNFCILNLVNCACNCQITRVCEIIPMLSILYVCFTYLFTDLSFSVVGF